jgi:tRNA nucleotidyltransferase (CCA-adding enzyme)
LPEVETSLIRQDLFRRDFSINAMAIALTGDSFGQLIDFFGSRRDLRNRELRVLHSLSFIDDPTRAIRAARYVRRLGFTVAPETRHLVEVAVEEGVFEMLSGERLRHELGLLLMEPHPPKSLALLAELGVITAIIDGLEWSDGVHSLLLEIQRQVAWLEVELPRATPNRLVLYVGGLAAEAGDAAGTAVVRRLKLSGGLAEKVIVLGAAARRVAAAAEQAGPLSELVEAIERVSLEASLLAMARLELVHRRKIASALLASHRLASPISGRDLLQRGIEPGPAVGRGLRAARRALIDGETRPERLIHIAETAARADAGWE